MIRQDALLVSLVQLVDRLPAPAQVKDRRRGRPTIYSDRLFLRSTGDYDRPSSANGA
jgi:hypothetical protein